MADKREFIRKIMAIAAKADSDFEGGENEKIETIAKLLEESEYAKSERGTANDEEPKEEKSEDKCGKDEEKDTKDEEEKETKDEDVKASDVMAFLNVILEEVRRIGEKKVADESEEKKEEEKAEDESESEKESKDEEKAEDEEEKETGDGVLFTFGQDKAVDGEDPAIKAYLA